MLHRTLTFIAFYDVCTVYQLENAMAIVTFPLEKSDEMQTFLLKVTLVIIFCMSYNSSYKKIICF